ncbi:MAG: FAD-dependent oxidoreductase, partial [Rubrivivax sp.]
MLGQAGTDLPAQWATRDDFVILAAGFGPGFMDTWAAWRADPRRCRRLVYIALDRCPTLPCARPDEPAHQALAQALAARWPVLTPGLHTLSFDEGPASQVTLLLGVGEWADLVPQLVAQIDAFDLQGVRPAPEAPNGDEGWLSRLARLAAPGATAIAQSEATQVIAGLRQSGFAMLPSLPGQASARYQPRHRPAPLPGGLWPNQSASGSRHALIIGAGLAGCAAAWALARQGWRCTVVDAATRPAHGASGNPGGLFHSILHGEDGIHARAHRAAALRTAAVVTPWLAQGRFAGDCQGLLRLDTHTATATEAQALLARLALPPDHVTWLDADQAAKACGIPVPSGGWLFHQGGWLDPAGYAQTLLDEAGQHALVEFIGGRPVQGLERTEHDGEVLWQARDAQGQLIARAPVVVLAGANESVRLMSTLAEAAALPLSAVRGQISALPLGPEVRPPSIPVAGAGYVLPAHQGQLLFGATSDAEDPDPTIRSADHAHNLAQAAQLGSLPAYSALPPGLVGRVAWRAVTPDRLPYVGPLPLAQMPVAAVGQKAPRADQPRFVPRLRDEHGGVYVITGLGSRGITWAALAGELLASWVTGSPSPVEAGLRDALDPARVVTRARAKQSHNK